MSIIAVVPSKKKEKQIKEFLASPLQAGEMVGFMSEYGKIKTYRVVSVDASTILASDNERPYITHVFSIHSIAKRYHRHIGANPFDKERDKIIPIQFSLDSIIHTLDLLGEKEENNDYIIGDVRVMSCNWDPYVYDAQGNKQRYQRPFVWTTSQKQALISSIYNGIDCGKVLVRERDHRTLVAMYENGERELSSHDIVDGKQRLNAVREFILGKFKDVHGNKFGDLSSEAQGQFLMNQLISYCRLPESMDDSAVLRQFLKLNFSGIPQSKAHMKYVESLYSNAK